MLEYMFFNQTWELSFYPKPKYKIHQNSKIKYCFNSFQKSSRKTCRKLKAALLWQSWQMVFWRRRLYWCVIASLQICQISQTSSYFISKKGNFSLETYLDFENFQNEKPILLWRWLNLELNRDTWHQYLSWSLATHYSLYAIYAIYAL